MAKRPFFVWVIFVFYMFSIISSAISFFGVHLGVIVVSDEKKAILDSLSFVDNIIGLATLTLNFVGAVALIKLQKTSFYFLASGLAFSILGSLIRYLSHGGWGQQNLGVFLGGLVSLAICLYVYKIKTHGILN